MLKGEHHEARHGGRISIVEGDADTEDGAGVALGAAWRGGVAPGAGIAGLRRDGASAGADLVYGAEVREPASYEAGTAVGQQDASGAVVMAGERGVGVNAQVKSGSTDARHQGGDGGVKFTMRRYSSPCLAVGSTD